VKKPTPELATDRIAERITLRAQRLSPSMRTVADYIRDNLRHILTLSALEIAGETGTSDATVIRTIQSLGFQGLRDLKDTVEHLLQSTSSPTEKMASTTGQISKDADAAIDFMINDQTHAMQELAKPENRAGLQRAISLLAQAHRIGVFGIGASGIIATYAARLFSRSGFPSYELNRTGISLAEQLIAMSAGDVIVMMAHGRIHREAAATIAEAERLCVPIIVIVTDGQSALLKHAATAITLPRDKSEHVALHAPLLCCIETLMLGLASVDRKKTLHTLNRLVDIRSNIRPKR
jgi:DNA-binding MurR/RpiR family transcriptional regulator